jgi:hypothetical protein
MFVQTTAGKMMIPRRQNGIDDMPPYVECASGDAEVTASDRNGSCENAVSDEVGGGVEGLIWSNDVVAGTYKT